MSPLLWTCQSTPQLAAALSQRGDPISPDPVGRLLATDWSQPYGLQARPIMHFVFDCGSLDDGADIVIQESELDGFRFTAPDELGSYLPPYGQARVAGALQARPAGSTGFLPHDVC